MPDDQPTPPGLDALSRYDALLRVSRTIAHHTSVDQLQSIQRSVQHLEIRRNDTLSDVPPTARLVGLLNVPSPFP